MIASKRILAAAALAFFEWAACLTGAAVSTATPKPPGIAFDHAVALPNGNGEEGSGSDDDAHIVKPHSWKTTGNFTVVRYGAFNYLPTLTDDGSLKNSQGATKVGVNFFAGGPPSSHDLATAEQVVPLPKGSRTLRISADLGGWYTQQDYAYIVVHFLDVPRGACRTTDCEAVLPPVTRAERDGSTTLHRTSCWTPVPTGSRRIRVVLSAKLVSGGYNDGYIDNVALATSTAGIPNASVPTCLSSEIMIAAVQPPAIAAVATLDNTSRACTWFDAAIFAAVLGFIVLSLVLFFSFWLNEPSLRPAFDPPGTGGSLWVRVVEEFRAMSAASPFTAIIAAASIAVVSGLVLPNLSSIGYFKLSDIGCLNQPWLAPSLELAALFAFVAGSLAWVFLSRWPPWTLRSTRLLRALALLVIALIAALASMVALAAYIPSASQLNAFIATLTICSGGMVYAIIAFWPSMKEKRTPRVVRVGLFFLLLTPTVQPLQESIQLHDLEQQRYATERQYRYLTVQDGPMRRSFDNIYFAVPDNLGFQNSGRVRFDAVAVDGGSAPKGCLFPRLVAPGFDVDAVLDEAAPASTKKLSWEWVITPKRTGEEDAFLSVLYSPDCSAEPKAGEPANGTRGADKKTMTEIEKHTIRPAQGGSSLGLASIEPIFTTSDTIFVSRPWFSLDYLNAVSGSLSAIIAIVTLVFGLFGLRQPGASGDATVKVDSKPQNGAAE